MPRRFPFHVGILSSALVFFVVWEFVADLASVAPWANHSVSVREDDSTHASALTAARSGVAERNETRSTKAPHNSTENDPVDAAASDNDEKNASTATSAEARSHFFSRPPKPRYLQYMANGGWSNQELCLGTAYYLARATNRILVLPPILPQSLGNKCLEVTNRIVDEASTPVAQGLEETRAFSSEALRRAYLHDLPPQSYVPLASVVDLQFAYPGVATIDLRDFYEYHWEESSMEDWVLENNFTHFDTRFVWNEPDVDRVFGDFVDEKNRSRVYQDLARLALEEEHWDLWTLYDAYFTGFFLAQSVHQQEFHIAFHRFRFTNPIREMARWLHEHYWEGIHYASVHIRGGDSVFALEETIHSNINNTMEGILNQIDVWILTRNNRTNLVGNEEVVPPTQIGLFVATDIRAKNETGQKELLEWPVMRQKVRSLQTTIGSRHNVTVQILRVPFHELEQVDRYRKLRELVGYPDQFLDQQLAGCAEIGFQGTGSSTFSGLVGNIRESAGAC